MFLPVHYTTQLSFQENVQFRNFASILTFPISNRVELSETLGKEMKVNGRSGI